MLNTFRLIIQDILKIGKYIQRNEYPREMKQREQLALCRLRHGHTNITHFYLLTGSQRPRCTCRARLTIDHLFTCPENANERETFFPNHTIPLGEYDKCSSVLDFILSILIRFRRFKT